MPVMDTNTAVHEYPLARRGINFYSNITTLHPEEALNTQNLIYRNGMKKRGGSSKFEDDEVQAGKKITGLHRFYYDTDSRQTLASSGTAVRYHNGTTWADIQTGLNDGANVLFDTWGALQKAYFANGEDELYSWDGSSAATLSGGNIPTSIIQVLPYQDRLLAIDNTNPGTLSWSDAFSTTAGNWVPASSTGVKPDSKLFGMVNHSINNSDSGYESAVLLAGANGMYLFAGTDLRTPATTGNYTIFPLATSVGCNTPRTMQWTPQGTIYLGTDGQVYILPFKSSTPIPIGNKIRSNQTGIEGIEDIPNSQIQNACAVYHDGYYKLSITQSGQTKNNVQFWLDVNRLHQDEERLWGPWYGPMLGMSISVFANLNGHGDNGELIGGESSGTTGAFVYDLAQSSVFADVGIAMQIYYQSSYNPLGNMHLRKSVHRMEAELLDVLGTVTIGFFDIDANLKIGDSFGLSGSEIFWDDNYWGEKDWSNSAPTRQVVNITPAIQPRQLSLTVSSSNDNDTFEIFALRVEATEQNKVFD